MGQFILTGSAVPDNDAEKEREHSGTGRFAWLTMRPMTLFEGFQKLKQAGKVIEDRTYNTIQGLLRYFTVLEGALSLDKYDYLMIGTLESYTKTKEYLGRDKLVPILIDLDDGERLQRALDRERTQEVPQYEEMCRRYLADVQDFSEKKIAEAGIERRFINDDLERCFAEIMTYLGEIL